MSDDESALLGFSDAESITLDSLKQKFNKLGWAEVNQAETVRLQLYAKLCFQV